jgi:hypothetical protein
MADKPDLSVLIKAVNEYFGEGKITGMVFFEHNPDGTVNKLNPLFTTPKINDPNCPPGEGIRQLLVTMKSWAAAINFMADDMVKRTLNKN